MISAFVATGILVGIGLLAIRAVRTIMPYELWYYLHLTSYLVLLLGLRAPVRRRPRAVRAPASAATFWMALYVFVLACLVWGRVIAPLRLNLRHRLRVAEVVAEGAGHVLDLRRAAGGWTTLQARAGQFFRWRFLARGCWWQAHPFSLSAAPNGRWLRLTIKAVGDHTEQLQWLEPGVRVLVGGTVGRLHRRPAHPPPGAAHRRRQRHRPDPGAAGGPAAAARS